MRRFLLLAAAVVVAAVWTTAAMANGGVLITSASIDQANRTLSANWNDPVGTSEGGLIVSTSPATDSTGELLAGTTLGPTLVNFVQLEAGWVYYDALPLPMTITSPTTVYIQVTEDAVFNDVFGNGPCTQGSLGVNCDSQVVALTVQPICSQVLVTNGYYTKTLVRRAHWLLRFGHRVKWSSRYHRAQYLKRLGHVWVRATHKQVWTPPVYQTVCQ